MIQTAKKNLFVVKFHNCRVPCTRSFFGNLKIQAGARCVLGYDGFEILQCKVSQSRGSGMANWTRVCVQEHLGQNCVRAGRAQLDKIQKCKKYKVQKYGRVCLVQEDRRQKCAGGGLEEAEHSAKHTSGPNKCELHGSKLNISVAQNTKIQKYTTN